MIPSRTLSQQETLRLPCPAGQHPGLLRRPPESAGQSGRGALCTRVSAPPSSSAAGVLAPVASPPSAPCGAFLPAARPPWWGSHPGGGRREGTSAPQNPSGSAAPGLRAQPQVAVLSLRSCPLTLPRPWDQPRAGALPSPSPTQAVTSPTRPGCRYSWACITGRPGRARTAGHGLTGTVRVNSLDAPISPFPPPHPLSPSPLSR